MPIPIENFSRIRQIITFEDILREADLVAEYHKAWNRFISMKINENGGKIPRNNTRSVNVADASHVLISPAMQFKNYPIFRAAIISENLGWIAMDPPQPIWNEAHMLKVCEQMGHVTKKGLLTNTTRSIVPCMLCKPIRPMVLSQRLSIENILTFQTSTFKNTLTTFENHYFTFYSAAGEKMAIVAIKVVAIPRDYQVLLQSLLKGEPVKELLLQKIKSQQNHLRQVGKISTINFGQLCSMVMTGPYDQQFSDWLDEWFNLSPIEQ